MTPGLTELPSPRFVTPGRTSRERAVDAKLGEWTMAGALKISVSAGISSPSARGSIPQGGAELAVMPTAPACGRGPPDREAP